MPPDLQVAFENARYNVKSSSGIGASADNAANHFTLKFAGAKTIVQAASGRAVTLRLNEYGWGSTLRPTGTVTHVAAHGNRFDRLYASKLQEWFENTPEGLEQGFVVNRKLERANGPLRIRLAADGDWRMHPVANGIRLTKGNVTLQYAGLKAWDSAGNALVSRLKGVGSEIEIEVDEEQAVYPLTVDPTLTQQQELTARDSAANDLFGTSVALSSDGDTAVVGAPNSNSGAGTAYVFVRAGTTWIQQQKLTAQDAQAGDYLGYDVALASDGNTAVIGAPHKNSNKGAVYVFARVGTSWTQQQELTASDLAQYDGLGESVTISGDGKTALAGAPGHNFQAGAAYVFTCLGTTWSQQQELAASDAMGSGFFGWSVALSGDGNTALAGAYGQNLEQGSAYVFTRSATNWSQQQELTAIDAADQSFFGWTVALSGDGNTALVGAPDTNSYAGSAYVFIRSGTNWSLEQQLTPADAAASDEFGGAVALSGNGNTALLGASGNGSGRGGVYLFTRVATNWVQQQDLTASDAATTNQFGGAVALAGDGNTILIGSTGNNSNAGATYVFTQPSSFGPVNVGQTDVGTLAFTVVATGTLGTPVILTGGTLNGDFTLAAGSTCMGAVAAGSVCSVNVTFAPQRPGLRSGAVEIVDTSGNILATTYVHGLGIAPQLVFGPGVETTVGSGLAGQGVALDGKGNVFIADTVTGQVLQASIGGGAQTVLASGLSNPRGIALDGAGNLYVADSGHGQVVELPAGGGPQTTVPFSGLVAPWAVAVDGSGNVFAVDNDQNQVVELLAGGGPQITLPFSGLSNPFGIALDAAGDVFVADTGNNRIVELPANGGTQISSSTGSTGPTGVAVDAAGSLFVAEAAARQVIEMPAGGGVQLVLFTSATLSPFSPALSAAGDIYVAGQGTIPQLIEIQRSQSPALSFAATAEGSTSSDSPQAVTIENDGNQLLTATGLSVGANFTQIPGSGPATDCSPNFSLAPGAVCNLSISFEPLASGPLQSAALLTDSSLNGNPAKQSISLTGTGLLTQSISFAPISTQTVGTPLSLSATATSDLTISYAASPAAVCAVSGNIATFVGGGTCSITASQAGNATYAPALPVIQSFKVSSGLPTLVSLTPAAGSGSPQAFTAVVSDPNGAADLNAVYVLFNSSVMAANGCYVLYQPLANQLFLKNDAGTTNAGPLTPGVAGQISNSRCTLSGTGSSYTTSGYTATLTVQLSFSVVAPTNVYLYAAQKLGGNTGFQQKGNWGMISQAPPSIASLNPHTGSEVSQAFTTVVTDVNGATDVNAIFILINSYVAPAHGCYVSYYPTSNQLFLKSDDGTSNSLPVSPGSSAMVSNSQCTLAGTGSSYTTVGISATLTVALTFSGSTPQYLFVAASDREGVNSGWVKEGTWGNSAGPPSAVSVTPNAGSGVTQTFSLVFSDPNGARDLTTLQVLFNTKVAAADSCYVTYDPLTNALYLTNDADTGRSAALTPGSTASVSNSQCTLLAAGSSYVTSGGTATLNVELTFTKTNQVNVYLYAAELLGSNTGWVQKGVWSPTAGGPAIISLTPASGSGAMQSFTAAFNDPNGAADLSTLALLFNTKISAAHACYVTYNPVTNQMYLTNDADTGQSVGAAPGSTATASNSQCTLSGTGSSYTSSGNTATLTLALQFSGTASTNAYLNATEMNGSTTGWAQKGTWLP